MFAHFYPSLANSQYVKLLLFTKREAPSIQKLAKQGNHKVRPLVSAGRLAFRFKIRRFNIFHLIMTNSS